MPAQPGGRMLADELGRHCLRPEILALVLTQVVLTEACLFNSRFCTVKTKGTQTIPDIPCHVLHVTHLILGIFSQPLSFFQSPSHSIPTPSVLSPPFQSLHPLPISFHSGPLALSSLSLLHTSHTPVSQVPV